MSEFQQLKWFIVHHLQLDKDGIHIYIGVACYVLAITIGRLPASSWRALLPGLVVSLLLEILDLFDTVRFGDRPDWGAGLWDLLNTHLIPVVLCLMARRGLLDRNAARAVRRDGDWSGRDEALCTVATPLLCLVPLLPG